MDSDRSGPRITHIATAVPEGDIDAAYHDWAAGQIDDPRACRLFERMSARSGICHRYSVLSGADSRIDPGSFYAEAVAPSTGERMEIFARKAPALAVQAAAGLPSVQGVSHLVVASCTGFLAPGLDQIVARQLGLDPSVERVSIGFMGCYAGITALRTAGHIVRSDPTAKVLVLAVELCTLHLQRTDDLERLLAMRQFADGAAAAIVSCAGEGLEIGEGISATLADSGELITWTMGDTGFAMELSGEVPGRLVDALQAEDLRARLSNGVSFPEIEAWAVHPGGKSILDAVERGLELPQGRLDHSRGVLQDFGNMSSATVLFVLERMMAERPVSGLALAFGPGLALEGLRFGWSGHAV